MLPNLVLRQTQRLSKLPSMSCPGLSTAKKSSQRDRNCVRFARKFQARRSLITSEVVATTCRRHRRCSVRHGARSFFALPRSIPLKSLAVTQEPRSSKRTCVFSRLGSGPSTSPSFPHGPQLRPRCWNTPSKPQEAGRCTPIIG